MIKMVVTDIDGTLYTPEIGIRQSVVDCLKKLIKNNIHLVIATGRTFKSAKSMADKFDVKVPLICYQGGIVSEYNGNLICEKIYSEKTARKVIDYLRKRNLHINLYIKDDLYVEQDDRYIKDYIKDKGIDYSVVDSFDNLDFSHVNKILAINYDADLIDELVDSLSKIFKDDTMVVKSTNYFCEIADISATKGNALKLLAQKWGLDISEVLAIGDQNNDIDMVVEAGIGVAMGNGTSEIKSQADFITDTVENDGFVKAINKFVFEE